jgi:hypothetical protein
MPAGDPATSAYESTLVAKVVCSRADRSILTVVPDAADALCIDTSVKNSVTFRPTDNVVFPGGWGSWLLPGRERS